jgi:hypothetical protein
LPLCPLACGGRFDLRRLPLWGGAPCPSLQVLRGAVWLTWPGCEADLFLRAGETVVLPPPAWGSPWGTVEGVLVEAEPRLSLAPAVVRLVASGGAHSAPRPTPCVVRPPRGLSHSGAALR